MGPKKPETVASRPFLDQPAERQPRPHLLLPVPTHGVTRGHVLRESGGPRPEALQTGSVPRSSRVFSTEACVERTRTWASSRSLCPMPSGARPVCPGATPLPPPLLGDALGTGRDRGCLSDGRAPRTLQPRGLRPLRVTPHDPGCRLLGPPCLRVAAALAHRD